MEEHEASEAHKNEFLNYEVLKAYLFTYFPLFVSATGNEFEMQGNPIEYNFQEPDYDDIDSDYVPGYRKCQAQCNGW